MCTTQCTHSPASWASFLPLVDGGTAQRPSCSQPPEAQFWPLYPPLRGAKVRLRNYQSPSPSIDSRSPPPNVGRSLSLRWGCKESHLWTSRAGASEPAGAGLGPSPLESPSATRTTVIGHRAGSAFPVLYSRGSVREMQAVWVSAQKSGGDGRRGGCLSSGLAKERFGPQIGDSAPGDLS